MVSNQDHQGEVIVLKNKIPGLLKERGISISELQRRAVLSYPTCYKIGADDAVTIPDQLQVGTLRKVAEALGVSIGDLVEIANEASL